MGCISSSTKHQGIPATSKILPLPSLLPPEKAGSFKVRILEAVKRKDSILFEKTLQQYKAKVSELLNGFDLRKTLLHHIAEVNFADGMTLAINYILQKDSKINQILAITDNEGNTPAMICCLCNSPETLEVIMMHDGVDLNPKNSDGKTALDLAFENSHHCVSLLTATTTTGNSKIYSKRLSSVEHLMSPRSKDRRTSKKTTKSGFESREFSSLPLISVLSLTKETSGKLGPNSRLYTIFNQLKDRDAEFFIDDEFPHTAFSIYGEEVMDSFGTGSAAMKWLRPTEFLGGDFKKIKLFESIYLNDISKSDLAGCELYSALGVLTEFPQRLLNTFTLKEINKAGAYSVRFLISGIPIEIVLDDFFPCTEKKSLLYSKPLANELWFLLLEKAFAKLYGSYSEIRNVRISDALEIITGMPSSQLNLKDIFDDELWENMQMYDRRNYIFCAGRDLRENEDPKKNRIFAIISLYEIENLRIVKLKDHFQDFEWEGMFSEKSKNWTKDLREMMGYVKGEKSCIYMELQEFMKHFDFLSISHFHEGWIRNKVETISGPNDAVIFEIMVDQEMELFISVHQKLPRFVSEVDNAPEYDISPVEMILVEKLDDGGLKRIAAGEKDALMGKQTTYANPGAIMKLSEGKYLVRAKIRWVDQKHHDLTLSTYSSKDLFLRQIRNEEYPSFLERTFIDAGSRIRERYQLCNDCEFISAWCGPYLWVYAVNKGKKTWTMDVVFQVLLNLRIPKKFVLTDRPNVVTMTLAPGDHRAFYAKRTDVELVEIAWNLNHTWR